MQSLFGNWTFHSLRPAGAAWQQGNKIKMCHPRLAVLTHQTQCSHWRPLQRIQHVTQPWRWKVCWIPPQSRHYTANLFFRMKYADRFTLLNSQLTRLIYQPFRLFYDAMYYLVEWFITFKECHLLLIFIFSPTGLTLNQNINIFAYLNTHFIYLFVHM